MMLASPLSFVFIYLLFAISSSNAYGNRYRRSLEDERTRQNSEEEYLRNQIEATKTQLFERGFAIHERGTPVKRDSLAQMNDAVSSLQAQIQGLQDNLNLLVNSMGNISSNGTTSSGTSSSASPLSIRSTTTLVVTSTIQPSSTPAVVTPVSPSSSSIVSSSFSTSLTPTSSSMPTQPTSSLTTSSSSLANSSTSPSSTTSSHSSTVPLSPAPSTSSSSIASITVKGTSTTCFGPGTANCITNTAISPDATYTNNISSNISPGPLASPVVTPASPSSSVAPSSSSPPQSSSSSAPTTSASSSASQGSVAAIANFANNSSFTEPLTAVNASMSMSSATSFGISSPSASSGQSMSVSDTIHSLPGPMQSTTDGQYSNLSDGSASVQPSAVTVTATATVIAQTSPLPTDNPQTPSAPASSSTVSISNTTTSSLPTIPAVSPLVAAIPSSFTTSTVSNTTDSSLTSPSPSSPTETSSIVGSTPSDHALYNSTGMTFIPLSITLNQVYTMSTVVVLGLPPDVSANLSSSTGNPSSQSISIASSTSSFSSSLQPLTSFTSSTSSSILTDSYIPPPVLGFNSTPIPSLSNSTMAALPTSSALTSSLPTTQTSSESSSVATPLPEITNTTATSVDPATDGAPVTVTEFKSVYANASSLDNASPTSSPVLPASLPASSSTSISSPIPMGSSSLPLATSATSSPDLSSSGSPLPESPAAVGSESMSTAGSATGSTSGTSSASTTPSSVPGAIDGVLVQVISQNSSGNTSSSATALNQSDSSSASIQPTVANFQAQVATVTIMTSVIANLSASKSSSQTSGLALSSSTTVISRNVAPVGVSAVRVSTTSATTEITPTATYSFNARAPTNIAVYFGQTPNTASTDLYAQCLDENVDIVMIGYLVSFNQGGSDYPQLNFGAACGGQTALQEQYAPGLLSCPQLAPQINNCQKLGKKVFLSIGGRAAAGNVTISSDAQATDIGGKLWDLFGGGNANLQLRPFGNATLDGFDFASTSETPQHYDALASTLRKRFAQDTSGKKYYISASPQCNIPDPSIPMSLMQSADFVWPQFYNNPVCDMDGNGTTPAVFVSTFKQWVETLGWNQNSPQPNNSAPMVLAGAVAWKADGSTGYVKVMTLNGTISLIRSYNGFGGMMLWDGTEAHRNTNYGKDYVAYAKMAIEPGAKIITQQSTAPAGANGLVGLESSGSMVPSGYSSLGVM
ncbi:MAG: hypothetical protein M1824_000304 [Vezdaea acicularis]|nr:MAG: hypothetical protein M1824_000304 [Vezdaea acicularis]